MNPRWGLPFRGNLQAFIWPTKPEVIPAPFLSRVPCFCGRAGGLAAARLSALDRRIAHQIRLKSIPNGRAFAE
jgi:hypothetical protein